MNRKYIFLAVTLTVIITLPLVAAAITQTQTLHIAGNAKYPHNLPPTATTPTPTPTPSSTETVKFSLFLPDGTAFPTTGGAVTTAVVDPMSGHNAGWVPTCIVVRNDGNVPITVTASLTNKNVPAEIELTLNCGFFGTISGGVGADQATNQQPIQPGQYYYMSLIAFLTPTAYNYTPDQTFGYSYDVVVTATQA